MGFQKATLQIAPGLAEQAIRMSVWRAAPLPCAGSDMEPLFGHFRVSRGYRKREGSGGGRADGAAAQHHGLKKGGGGRGQCGLHTVTASLGVRGRDAGRRRGARAVPGAGSDVEPCARERSRGRQGGGRASTGQESSRFEPGAAGPWLEALWLVVNWPKIEPSMGPLARDSG